MSWFDFPSLLAAGVVAASEKVKDNVIAFIEEKQALRQKNASKSDLENEVAQIASFYKNLAVDILCELIKFPSEHTDCDEQTLTQNFLEFVKGIVIRENAMVSDVDIKIEKGALVWSVYNPENIAMLGKRTVVYINSSFAGIFEKPADWSSLLGSGIDPYKGMIDEDEVEEVKLQKSLGYIPQGKEWWKCFTFGHNAASLQGICSQILTMKILVETMNKGLGSLDDIVVVASCARDHHEAIHEVQNVPVLPDCIIISEPTGSTDKGSCGFAIGQLGTTVFDVKGENLGIELGARIIAEAFEASGNLLSNDPDLGKAERITTEATLADEFKARFIRTLTVGEDRNTALQEITALPTVIACGGDKLTITEDASCSCPAWKTPKDHPAIQAAAESYITVSAYAAVECSDIMDLRKTPSYGHRHKGDKSPGYPISISSVDTTKLENWITVEQTVMPPMFAIGSGFTENIGLPGEYVSNMHLTDPIVIMTIFPSKLKQHLTKK